MTDRDAVRWGILGTGDINRRFLPGARQSASFDAIAVGSRSRERGEAFAREFGIPRVHDSYDSLLADPDVQAVYICLPNSMHHAWTMRALAAGKHVLCEKPYSRRPADVTEAFDAADAAGLVLQEAFMWRHSPQTRLLRELLPRIGDLQTVRATFSFVIGSLEDVRLARELDGGSLMDVGCYCVSGSRLVSGEEPDRVQAEQVLGPSGVDVRFTGLLHFPSGVTSTFTSGFTTDHMGLEAIGTKGSIRVPDPYLARTGLVLLDDEEHQVDVVDPYRAEVDDMCEAIRGEHPTLLSRADALGQARAIAALYRAAEVGASVAP